MNESNPEKKVAEFINFLPVLAYQDCMMQQIDAAQILDIAMSGTTASLLVKFRNRRYIYIIINLIIITIKFKG